MRKIISVVIVLLLSVSGIACGSRWTEETARLEAFSNIRRNIDISQYQLSDPDYAENQNALTSGKQWVEDRFVSKNPEPPIGYVVSKINRDDFPVITMFYKADGSLISVRLFSKPKYPRTAYIYCVDKEACRYGNSEYESGELMSVSFHVSSEEMFYFNPEGESTGHVKF